MQAISKMVAVADGKPRMRPINELVIEELERAAKVARDLAADGHTIIGVRAEPSGGLPTVQLASSSRLSAMVARNEAAYYRSTSDQIGTYHTGQFQIDGVRVLWIEMERH